MEPDAVARDRAASSSITRSMCATCQRVIDLVSAIRPDAIVHACKPNPRTIVAAAIPFDDFDTNAVGTLNLLEAARKACPDSPFVYMSTNKVYGDRPNSIKLRELETRWDYARSRL